ncbi:HVO_0476 family zinc finger protein [Halorarius halobius]|uniref:HVO_0476 family zinc finger protein n=1 Tax=Halorarius halobius TaxID=2962671 RepID=UPI0020CC842F|nr:HVO_0476 family zinc finger protein [Halorarius halobius]
MSTSRVAVACPSCSPEEPTAHEVLKEAGLSTVRCTECDHVHKEDLSGPETVERQVVVSQDGDSFSARHEFPPGTELETGDEFLLDAPEALMQVRITSLQKESEQRVDRIDVETVQTVWTRAVGNVSVDLTLHPKGGEDEETRSLKLQVPGDEKFEVGEVAEYGGEEFEIEGFVVRDGAEGYTLSQYDHDGDWAFAKDLKRVYGRDQTTSAWSAW